MSRPLRALRAELRSAGDADRAAGMARFFKTGPGEYGDGDAFLGLAVPDVRRVITAYLQLPLDDLDTLLRKGLHEERFAGLLILVDQYRRGEEAERKAIYDFYIAHTSAINNWDLVDCSAEFIVGPWLEHRDKTPLDRLAMSDIVWERRIAMLATFHYIKQGDPAEALRIADILLLDQHDLIHKSVGWMLREVGKRCSVEAEESFLATRYQKMPRTMLRYAIERFPPERRRQYLRGEV